MTVPVVASFLKGTCVASKDMDMVTIMAVARATELVDKGETNIKRVVKQSIDEAIQRTRLSIDRKERKIIADAMMATF